MKNILSCAVILFFAMGCRKTNNNDSNPMGSDIFPNKVGDNWVYRVNDTSYLFQNSGIVSEYNMTVSVTGSVQLPGIGTANVWVYNFPGGTDTNYVFQHGDTISFIANNLPYIYIVKQYIIPLRLHNSWQYVVNSIRNITVDSLSAITVEGNHFENAYHIGGVPGVPDNFFLLDEWVADNVGVVKRYFNNRGYTIGPFQNKTSWSLVSYHLE